MADSTIIGLTEFHNRPGVAVDRSQIAPVTLTKHNRPYAVVVSAAWFGQATQALEELHGHRRVLATHDLSAEDRDFIMKHGPTDEEIATGKWQD